MSLDQAVLDKQADLAGPGVGDCAELEKVLPHDCHSGAGVESVVGSGPAARIRQRSRAC